MSELQIFQDNRFGEVRVATTDNNEPLFCLTDVCKILCLKQGHVRERLDDGVVSTEPIIDSLGREQTANFVNEDGLYDVILDSRKPEAKIEEALLSPYTIIKLATNLKEEREQRKMAEMERNVLQAKKERAKR